MTGSGSAKDASNDRPNQPLAQDQAEPSRLNIAYDLLVELVGELSASGRPPTGSEVRLALKSRTYDGFDLKSLGFGRFRDFLTAAASRGHIEIDESRPGDVAVQLPDSASTTPVVPSAIRGDLWKAFIEWGPDELRLYDTSEDKVVRLPRAAAPLEPERFATVRRSLAETPDRFVAIPPINRKVQVEWMHEFAGTRANDVRQLLVQALASDKPSKTFVQVLRALPEERARWQEALLSHVRSRVEEWRRAAGVDIAIDKRSDSEESGAAPSGAETPPDSPPAPAAGRLMFSARHAPRPSPDETLSALTAIGRAQRLRVWRTDWRTLHSHLETPSDAQTELRRRLHEAIDRMPVDELRRLAIPVGYLFED